MQFINDRCALGVDHFRDESKFNKKNRVRKCFRNDLAVLEELSSYYSCGEDVSCIMSWSIKDVKVDDGVNIDNDDDKKPPPKKQRSTNVQ